MGSIPFEHVVRIFSAHCMCIYSLSNHMTRGYSATVSRPVFCACALVFIYRCLHRQLMEERAHRRRSNKDSNSAKQQPKSVKETAPNGILGQISITHCQEDTKNALARSRHGLLFVYICAEARVSR